MTEYSISGRSSPFGLLLCIYPQVTSLAQETLSTLASIPTDQLVLFLQICDQILGLEDELEESKWRLGSVQAVLQGEALETAFEEIGKHEVRYFLLGLSCFVAWSFQRFFLDAPSHLYKRVCPSVRPSVGPSRVIFRRVLGASCAVYPALF